VENKDNFELPEYYNTKKPKSEENLVKRKCFACSKEKAMGKFERYCSDDCRSRATRYYQTPNSISW
jgi:hypothetical protein